MNLIINEVLHALWLLAVGMSQICGTLINVINEMATKRIVGQVLPEERDEIQQLFERRNGLNELARIVTADNIELYEKLVKDLGETGTRFHQWWNRMEQKYQWEGCDDSSWEINFNTCDIYLVGGQCDECNA